MNLTMSSSFPVWLNIYVTTVSYLNNNLYLEIILSDGIDIGTLVFIYFYHLNFLFHLRHSSQEFQTSLYFKNIASLNNKLTHSPTPPAPIMLMPSTIFILDICIYFKLCLYINIWYIKYVHIIYIFTIYIIHIHTFIVYLWYFSKTKRNFTRVFD